MKKTKDNHYVDNNKFFDEMCKWKKQVIEAEEMDEPRPPVTEYIGTCFMEIAERLSHRPNFINYEYREEMVGDGIENCLMYAHNFNPEKSKNPFSYFTQIIYYAFLRRIQAEKKQVHIKNKSIEKQHYEAYTTLPGDNTVYNIDETLMNNMLPEEDVYKPKKKVAASKKGLEVFMEGED